MQKKLKAALAAFFVLLAAPVQAANRLNYYSGIVPPSQWYNLQQRYERLAEGAFKTAIFGTVGSYQNLSVTPQTGLYVQVGPANSGTVGSLYQFLADDVNPYPQNDPINRSYELAADPTTITLQGTTLTNGSPIGPLTVPGSNSQISLIECQVTTVDSNTVSTNFISQLGTLQSETVSRDRADQISCQAKAGTPAPSPTVPSTDTGWIAIGYVTIPSGTSTITSGMITASPSLGHAVMDGAASTQTIQGAKTFSLPISGLSSIIAGSATAATTNAGDLAASRSTTTGAIWLGGSGSACTLDFGVVTASKLTAGCAVNGTSSIVAGSATAPTATAGDLAASQSTTTGAVDIGGSSSSCTVDYGVTTASKLTAGCGLNGTGAIIAGSATAPSVSSGDLAASRSTTTGVIKLGGSSSSCAANYGVTTASTLTVPCATTITSALASTSSGSTASYVPPAYTTAGAAIASTVHSVLVSGTCSSSSSTAGPFTGFVSTVSLTNAAQFSSVTTSATSFDVGGGSALAANSYWLHDFGNFTVEWNSASTIYVQCVGASQPYHFLAVGY